MTSIDPTSLLTLLDAARDLVVEVADDGTVTTVAGEDAGHSRPLSAVVHPDDLPAIEQALLGGPAQPGDSTTFRTRTRTAPGNGHRRVGWTCSRTEDGRWLCLGRDVEREARLRETQHAAQIGDWEYVPESQLLYPSAVLQDKLGRDGDPAPIPIADYFALVPEEERERARKALDDAVRECRPFQTEWRLAFPAETLWIDVRARPVLDADGRLVAMHGMSQNISARKRSEQEARFQAGLIEQVDAAVVATDLSGRVTLWNSGAERMFGYAADEATGVEMATHLIPADQRARLDERVAAILETGRWEGELILARRDGAQFPVVTSDALMRDDAGRPTGFVGVMVDITERKRSAREVAEAQGFLAAVTDHMAEGLYTVDHKGRLTYINPAAERMLGWRAEELTGRSIHDVIHHTRANGEPHPREECPMVKVLRDQVTVRVEDDVFIRRNGSQLPVAYSSSPLSTAEGETGSVVVFSDVSERKAEQLRLLREIDDLAWVSRIRDAQRENRFVLYAQPIVDLRSRKVVQHELLIRMRSDDGGLIAPGDFLPTAEKYGLIQNIDRWVIWEAARLAAGNVPVELNISAETCGSPELLETFEAALRAAGASPHNIVVEITETALMKGEAADELVNGLGAMGIKLALDDFGTGYGGFTYLKRLPVHFLKIDREFVRDLHNDRPSRHVVEAVVTLARGFGQKTIAEGVEDPETLAILGELGVDYAQGFHLGRPAPVEGVLLAWEA